VDVHQMAQIKEQRFCGSTSNEKKTNILVYIKHLGRAVA
jgi:hypothetical protein